MGPFIIKILQLRYQQDIKTRIFATGHIQTLTQTQYKNNSFHKKTFEMF